MAYRTTRGRSRYGVRSGRTARSSARRNRSPSRRSAGVMRLVIEHRTSAPVQRLSDGLKAETPTQKAKF